MAKSNNYEMFYYEGISFLIASWAIYKKFENVILANPSKSTDYYIGVYWASHVNHAYALEMFLKSLSILERGEYRFGHNLYEIFSDLKDNTQKEIINDSKLGSDKFIEYLKEFEEPFKKFRYWSEHKDLIPKYKLDTHAEVIRNFIRKLKPDLPETF